MTDGINYISRARQRHTTRAKPRAAPSSRAKHGSSDSLPSGVKIKFSWANETRDRHYLRSLDRRVWEEIKAKYSGDTVSLKDVLAASLAGVTKEHDTMVRWDLPHNRSMAPSQHAEHSPVATSHHQSSTRQPLAALHVNGQPTPYRPHRIPRPTRHKPQTKLDLFYDGNLTPRYTLQTSIPEPRARAQFRFCLTPPSPLARLSYRHHFRHASVSTASPDSTPRPRKRVKVDQAVPTIEVCHASDERVPDDEADPFATSPGGSTPASQLSAYSRQRRLALRDE